MTRSSSDKLWLILAASLFANSCAGQTPQAQMAREQDRLRNSLNVKCLVTEEKKPASPYLAGSFKFYVTLELDNTGSDGLQFDDDMILLDGSPEQDYTGAYAVYHKTGSGGGAWGDDYYGRAHN